MQAHLLLLLLIVIICSIKASPYSLKIAQPTISFGDNLYVNFTTSSKQDSYDWIAIFKRDDCDVSHNCFLDMQYISKSYVEKQVVFSSLQVPLQIGDYDVRYFKRDSYFSRSIMEARAEFSVVSAAGTN